MIFNNGRESFYQRPTLQLELFLTEVVIDVRQNEGLYHNSQPNSQPDQTKCFGYSENPGSKIALQPEPPNLEPCKESHLVNIFKYVG